MHDCPRCGQACDCSGDLDDCYVLTEEWALFNCQCDCDEFKEPSHDDSFMEIDYPEIQPMKGLFIHSKPRRGFYYEGIPYFLPDSVSDEDFYLFWALGWRPGLPKPELESGEGGESIATP